MLMNVEQKDFVAALAHDLKNPLLAQLRSLELIKEGAFGALNEKQTEMLNLTIESAANMKKMLYTLLDDYSSEGKPFNIKPKNFQISKLIKSCVDELNGALMYKKLKIRVLFNLKADETLFGDEMQLRRVTENVLNNALKHSFPKTEIKIGVFKKENKIRFEFENTGDKIPPEIKNKIFDKFLKASNDTLNTGLGLYISKKIVEAHLGSIGLIIKGNVNKFYFEIPQNLSLSGKETDVKKCKQI